MKYVKWIKDLTLTFFRCDVSFMKRLLRCHQIGLFQKYEFVCAKLHFHGLLECSDKDQIIKRRLSLVQHAILLLITPTFVNVGDMMTNVMGRKGFLS